MWLRLLLLVFVFSPGKTGAQYLFTTLQTKDGLSSQSVTSLLRDSDGFLWLGTHNGLNRYDGSSVKVYNWAHHNYPLDHNEIIKAINEIQKGSLLIGTRNGLLRFSSYEKQFSPVHLTHELMKQAEDLEVQRMVTDPLGKTWITTSQGLCMYVRDTVFYAREIFDTLRELDHEFTFTGFIALDTLRKGVWLTTNHGLCLIDYNSGDFTTHRKNPQQNPIFRNAPTGTVALHPLIGDIWWSDSIDILIQHRVADNSIHSYNHLTEKYGHLVRKDLFVDSQGRVWFSTWTSQMLVIEPSGTVSLLPQETIAPYGLNSVFVNQVIEDPNGDLWFATFGGAARVSGSNTIHNVIDLPYDNAEVNSFNRLDKNNLIIGTNAGLILYNEPGKRFALYKIHKEGWQRNRIFSLQQIGEEWWCGTGGGIYIFNPVTGVFRHFDPHPYTQEIDQRSVSLLMKDSHGMIWFTTWGAYVYGYNPAKRQCIRYDGTEPYHGDIGRGNCLALKEDPHGRIWLGYGDNGIRVYADSIQGFQKLTRDTRLETTVVSNFAVTAEGQIWVSTWGDGLFKLDMQGKVIDHLNTQHGLTSNFTCGVSADVHGRIWFGTPEAVHYLHPGSLLVSKINFDLPASLGEDWVSMVTGDRFNYACLKDRILVIDQTSLDLQEKPGLPLISAINVFEEEIPYSQTDPDLHLKYNQNFFRIDFSSPQHHEFPSLRYAYILEGFNRDWVYCDRQLSAGFTNVPHGEYIFRVKASDQNGRFYDENRHLTIVIQPPFWQTTWFYFLCFGVAGYLLFLIYRLIQRRREKSKSDQIIDYFANSVYSENSVSEICWDIARNCISQLGFQDCIVFIMNEERSHLIQKAAFGPKYPKGSDNLNPLRIPVGHGIIGTVAAEGRPLLIPDTSKDPRYIADDVARLSEISVPIMYDQKVIGVIDSEHPQKQFFTQEHLKTLSTIASISAFKIADAQAQMLARENELKLLELNTLFAESQLKALRAQMNPHFVFNCLNSIQECIVTKKYGEASSYLNKFAKLFRLVLNNSGKMLITIDEEVDILTLYLELELMRFDHSFAYMIDIDPALESDDILMPSMFMQPFVENALWHGLMHKAGVRRLEVSFRKVSEEVFACTVDDNGIGRKASAEYRKQRIFGQSYDSKGMKMNLERIEILRRQGFYATLHIIDKEDASGTASGTTVIAEFSNNLTYH